MGRDRPSSSRRKSFSHSLASWTIINWRHSYCTLWEIVQWDLITRKVLWVWQMSPSSVRYKDKGKLLTKRHKMGEFHELPHQQHWWGSALDLKDSRFHLNFYQFCPGPYKVVWKQCSEKAPRDCQAGEGRHNGTYFVVISIFDHFMSKVISGSDTDKTRRTLFPRTHFS